MANIKEIVTKAVIGKSKKKNTEDIKIITEIKIDKVLGCWIINHSFKGEKNESGYLVRGSYDLNLWYSYDNNTKTSVLVKTINYEEKFEMKLKNPNEATDVTVKALTAPNVSKADINENVVTLSVEKELGIEVIGETKVKVNAYDEADDYEEIEDEDIDIKEDYLNDVNQK